MGRKPKQPKKEEPRVVFVVSDVSGDTCARFARSLLDQFPVEFIARRFPHVRTTARLAAIMTEAKTCGAWVLYTLVNPQMWVAMDEAARAAGVIATNLMGGPLADGSRWLGMNPLGVPQHRLTHEYQRIISAVEFTDLTDDGRQLNLLPQADIVLIGVSRSSKTVLARFLAQSGYKVANVPFTENWMPTEELSSINPRRVFVLLMDAEAIARVRSVRNARDDVSRRSIGYAKLETVMRELESLREYCVRHQQWNVLTIHGGIEETAAEVLELLDFYCPATT